MTKGKKANRGRKSRPPPPPPLSSRSGFATAIALQNVSVVLESQLFPVFKISTRPTKFTIGVVHFSGLPPVKSGSCPCFTAGSLYCFVTYQLGHTDFLSSHLAKQRFEISGHVPSFGHYKEVADVLQVLI